MHTVTTYIHTDGLTLHNQAVVDLLLVMVHY